MLQAVDVAGPWQWRWLLTDESTGQPVADHRVQLDPASEQVVAFSDLYGYARSHAAPDRRVPDEARIVAQAGAWAGRVLLGEPVGAAIVAAAPVTVRVSVPPQVQPVALWPLELAHAGGWPLAARGDVTLVYDVAQEPDGAGRPKDPVAGALRVLAVFSQPTRTGVVALRRARYALGRLIRQVAARQRGLVELRVVQYGVTRERLAGIVDSGDGWDVLQLWGHGGRGLFLLEHADGSPDPVDTADLVKLLRPSRRRVKLAVVSACESAADVTAETLRLVGLVPQAERLEREQVPPGPEMLGGAQAVAGELDCAVVGMRYPVTDEFAIAFGDLFYEHLLVRGQPVDVAAARAVAEAAGSGEGAASAARPAVSVATPGVFGRRAAGLRLTVPRGTPLLNPNDAGMPYFPPEPARFVGRAQAMAQASMALAPGSGRTAVLLHGMAGAGKTACALELAYRHQDAFGAVAFWQAPTRDDEFAGAMVRLAESLEIQLGDYGFTMTGHIGTVPALEAFLPRLRRVLETSGVLLVLDNLETLLTPEGTWRDPRWKPLVAALTGHGGESRLLLTSRIQPAGLDAQLAAAEAAAAGQGLEAFFRDGASRLDPDQFLAALTRWTTTALTVLPPPARLLAEFLACMEDDDRQSGIIKANWADLWRRLDRPGDPPEPGPLLEALAAAALIQPQAPPAAASDVAPPADSAPADSVPASPADSVPASPVTYRMHPGVAAAIAAAAGEGIRAAADTELAAYWQAVAGQAQEREGGEDSGLVVRAGLAAAPYLLRRRDWDTAGALLEGAIVRDESPGVIQAALPALRRIAAATRAPAGSAVLARALRTVDPAGAGTLLREALRAAAGAGDYRLASGIAGDLVNLLRDAGRLAEALDLAGQRAGYTGRAGLGPWTQLLDQGQRLQILALMGEHRQVLAETGELRARMRQLSAGPPARPAGNETATPWNVRELILDTGRTSALALADWQQCLDLNAEILTSKRQRGAGAHEIARTRFNNAGPLIRVGRLAEAGQLLRQCQQVFEDHHDTTRLAMVLSTRASLEDALGHRETAAGFARTALRLGYARPDPRDIATSHHNLASYLLKAGGDPAGQRAHRLAAALIRQLTGMAHDLAGTLRELAADLREDPGAGRLPATLAEVIQVAGQTDGVRLAELITALEPDTGAAEAALAQILRTAADLPAEG